MMRSIMLSGLLGLFVCVGLAEADWLGVKGILERLDAVMSEGAAEDEASPIDAFLKDLDELEISPGKFGESEPAQGWLALLSRYEALKKEDASYQLRNNYSDNSPGKRLFGLLPEPEHWSALGDQLDAEEMELKRVELLRVYVDVLLEDVPSAVSRVEAIMKTADEDSELDASAYNALLEGLVQRQGDKNAIVQWLKKKLAMQKISGKENAEFEVPDVIHLMGEEDAEAFLIEAMIVPGISLSFRQAEETLAMARELALENIDALTGPQWGLLQAVGLINLYEAMEEKFGETPTPSKKSGMDDWGDYDIDIEDIAASAGMSLTEVSRLMSQYSKNRGDRKQRNATLYYILSLIADGRVDDAYQKAKAMKLEKDNWASFPVDGLDFLQKEGFVDEVYTFVKRILADKPESPFWGTLVELGARAQRSDETVEIVEKALAKADENSLLRGYLNEKLQSAYLAHGKVDEAVELIRAKITSLGDSEEDEKLKRDQGFRLARLGQLLENSSWVDEGLEVADSVQAEGRYRDHQQYIEMLRERGELSQLEVKVMDAMVAEMKKAKNNAYGMAFASYGMQEHLVALAGVYHASERYDDVLMLFDSISHWGVDDAVSLQHQTILGKPLLYILAHALVETSRGEEALPIVKEVLRKNGGLDDAYALLIKIQGADSMSFLDELYAADPFEERPLIWKAQLLLDDGKLAEAEEICKSAIAIDPSDGEQGKGDRMRVYAVLGKVKEAQGDAEQAAFFEDVIKAIRLAEEADEFYDAGLLSAGVEMYERSLGFFADAYCIQSRMAVQLEGMGEYERAEEHYQKAFELMPDSFGRVESHCFGCEGVFSSDRAKGIAERVFVRLLKENSEKPQVHYLMGYLKGNQREVAEAFKFYQKAVELDPMYLNAWKNMSGLAGSLYLPPEERTRLNMKLLELDPGGKHAAASLGDILDLDGLWKQYEALQSKKAPKVEALYELTASKKENERKNKAMKDAGINMQDWSSWQWYSSYGRGILHYDTPQKMLMSHTLLDSMIDLYLQN